MDSDISKFAIKLTEEQWKPFETQLKIAMYIQLNKNGFLNNEQLRKLIIMNRREVQL